MSIKLFKYMNGNKIRIPKSWILLAAFIVSVIGAGAWIYTVPPNGLTNQTGIWFGNNSLDGKNLTGDKVDVFGVFGIVIGSYIDSYSCPETYCIYRPAYAYDMIYAKNMSTGNIDYSGSYPLQNQSVIEDAISKGHHISLGSNITYVPTANTIPPYAWITGTDNTSIISATNPMAQTLTMGAFSQVQNVMVNVTNVTGQEFMGVNSGTPRMAYNFVNNMPNGFTPSWWAGKAFGVSTGSYGYDAPGISVVISGVGDALSSYVNDTGVGLRVEVNKIYPAQVGIGEYILNYGAGRGIWVVNANGSSGVGLRLDSDLNSTGNLIEMYRNNTLVSSINDTGDLKLDNKMGNSTIRVGNISIIDGGTNIPSNITTVLGKALYVGSNNRQQLRLSTSNGTPSGVLINIDNNGLFYPLNRSTSNAPYPDEGAVYYDNTLHVLRYANNTKWVNVTPINGIY